MGEPVGEGHGHYAMDSSGYVTYRRDVGEDHGPQNFTNYEERPFFSSQYHDDGQLAGLTQGGDRSWETPVHATDAEGNDVTVAFGREGTKYEGHSLIAKGHLTSEEFYGEDAQGRKNHEHYDGKGGGTSRDKYDG